MVFIKLPLVISTLGLSAAPHIDFLAVAIGVANTVLAIQLQVSALWLVISGADRLVGFFIGLC